MPWPHKNRPQRGEERKALTKEKMRERIAKNNLLCPFTFGKKVLYIL